MTRRRALELLQRRWGGPGVVPPGEVREIEAVAQPDETLLATVVRVAGLASEMSVIPPFAHEAVYLLASRKAFEVEIEEARARKGGGAS